MLRSSATWCNTWYTGLRSQVLRLQSELNKIKSFHILSTSWHKYTLLERLVNLVKGFGKFWNLILYKINGFKIVDKKIFQNLLDTLESHARFQNPAEDLQHSQQWRWDHRSWGAYWDDPTARGLFSCARHPG